MKVTFLSGTNLSLRRSMSGHEPGDALGNNPSRSRALSASRTFRGVELQPLVQNEQTFFNTSWKMLWGLTMNSCECNPQQFSAITHFSAFTMQTVGFVGLTRRPERPTDSRPVACAGCAAATATLLPHVLSRAPAVQCPRESGLDLALWFLIVCVQFGEYSC